MIGIRPMDIIWNWKKLTTGRLVLCVCDGLIDDSHTNILIWWLILLFKFVISLKHTTGLPTRTWLRSLERKNHRKVGKLWLRCASLATRRVRSIEIHPDLNRFYFNWRTQLNKPSFNLDGLQSIDRWFVPQDLSSTILKISRLIFFIYKRFYRGTKSFSF